MRYLIIVCLLFLAINVYAVDTKIQNIELTKNQIQHLSDAAVGSVKGIGYWNDKNEIVITSENELTKDEIQKIENDLKNLPNTGVALKKTLEERVSDLEKKVDAIGKN